MSIKAYIEAVADATPEPEPNRPPLRSTQAAGGGVVIYEERDADCWLWAETDAVVDIQEVEADE